MKGFKISCGTSNSFGTGPGIACFVFLKGVPHFEMTVPTKKATRKVAHYWYGNILDYSLVKSFSMRSCSSSANNGSTKIRPLCSSVMIFLRDAIST